MDTGGCITVESMFSCAIVAIGMEAEEAEEEECYRSGSSLVDAVSDLAERRIYRGGTGRKINENWIHRWEGLMVLFLQR